jgi:hypothetical protein
MFLAQCVKMLNVDSMLYLNSSTRPARLTTCRKVQHRDGQWHHALTLSLFIPMLLDWYYFLLL